MQLAEETLSCEELQTKFILLDGQHSAHSSQWSALKYHWTGIEETACLGGPGWHMWLELWTVVHRVVSADPHHTVIFRLVAPLFRFTVAECQMEHSVLHEDSPLSQIKWLISIWNKKNKNWRAQESVEKQSQWGWIGSPHAAQESVERQILKRQWGWFGHTSR